MILECHRALAWMHPFVVAVEQALDATVSEDYALMMTMTMMKYYNVR